MGDYTFSSDIFLRVQENIHCVNYSDEVAESKKEPAYICDLKYFHTEDTEGIDNNRYSEWNLIIIDHCQNQSLDLPKSLNKLIERFSDGKSVNVTIEQLSLLQLAQDAYTEYMSENEGNENNAFIEPSFESFLQFLRFIPDYRNTNSVYLDEKTGCFGLVMQGTAPNKPILNLLLKENREIVFSYIKRRKKLIKISGRAYFGDHLEDSCEISKLINWLK